MCSIETVKGKENRDPRGFEANKSVNNVDEFFTPMLLMSSCGQQKKMNADKDKKQHENRYSTRMLDMQ